MDVGPRRGKSAVLASAVFEPVPRLAVVWLKANSRHGCSTFWEAKEKGWVSCAAVTALMSLTGAFDRKGCRAEKWALPCKSDPKSKRQWGRATGRKGRLRGHHVTEMR